MNPTLREVFLQVFSVSLSFPENDIGGLSVCLYSSFSILYLGDLFCLPCQVLQRLRYVDANNAVQLKGRVACEISNHELIITELVFENAFTNLHPTEIVALLSCFVFQQVKRLPPIPVVDEIDISP